MVGLMVGLFDAQRTGVGRDVDISLLDTAVSMLSYFAVWTLNRDWIAERTRSSAHQTIVPAQNFPTRDGWIVIFCNKDKFWRDLVETLGAPELAEDARFRTFADRFANKDALLPLLQARFATRTTSEWLDRLRGRVPCAPVNDVRQALADPQVLARDMIVEVEHPDFGPLREVRSPVRTEGEIRHPARAPRLGEHTDQILREILSYSDGTIARLRETGVIG
jgi:crotonobetainyl-CoA:carnitine CoA-transferase CaiB-like acyl-CoA transferase